MMLFSLEQIYYQFLVFTYFTFYFIGKKSATSMNCLNLVLEFLYLHFPFSQAEQTSTTTAQCESGTRGSGSSLIHAPLYFIS